MLTEQMLPVAVAAVPMGSADYVQAHFWRLGLRSKQFLHC